MTYPAIAPTRPATTSEMLYLLGAANIAPQSFPDGWPRHLAQQFQAKQRRLAPELVAGALWSLHAAKAATLELTKSKSLGFISKTELIATARQAPTGWYGIEAELLAVLAAKSPREVGSVVRDWFGKKVSNADVAVIERVQAHAAHAGLVELREQDAGRGRIGGLLRGRTTVVVVPSETAISGTADALTVAVNGWIAFTQNQPELAAELVKSCQKAIDAREYSTDSGSDGGGSSFD